MSATASGYKEGTRRGEGGMRREEKRGMHGGTESDKGIEEGRRERGTFWIYLIRARALGVACRNISIES